MLTTLSNNSKTPAAADSPDIDLMLCIVDQKSGVLVISFLSGLGDLMQSASPLRMGTTDFSRVG